MFGENTKSHQSQCFSNPWCDPKWLYHFFRFTTISHKTQPWFVFLLALALIVKTKSEAAYVFKKCHWLANWKCLAFFDKLYIFFNLPTHPLSNYACFNYIQRGFFMREQSCKEAICCVLKVYTLMGCPRSSRIHHTLFHEQRKNCVSCSSSVQVSPTAAHAIVPFVYKLVGLDGFWHCPW